MYFLRLIKKITNWEQWPFQILYAPLAPVWLYYIIRSGSVWFFTPSNPKITFGGMEGEPKKEMHELLPATFCPEHFNVKPGQTVSRILQSMKEHGLSFPVIVKPEVGEKGILVRKIDNESQLKFYHDHVPEEYIIQKYVSLPMEVSLFYYRYPWEKKGKITGFLQKVSLRVSGDGVHTLKELILENPKAKKQIEMLKKKFGDSFEKIIPEGEIIKLSHAGNHNRGAHFIDLKNEIDENLTMMLDKISLSIDDFFYGRYDIMCQSIEDLKKGKNFYILEYNGCGAEPNHFYDTGYTLKEAYLEIMMHWKKLFTISRYNHMRGIPYWPFFKGLHFLRNAKKQVRIAQQIDLIIP
ncbi:MAG: hypothetical protein J0H55_00510 [Chitinophagaceae bacterium]|nr:hypothetical protein [Chitinophagaceae bacterium]